MICCPAGFRCADAAEGTEGFDTTQHDVDLSRPLPPDQVERILKKVLIGDRAHAESRIGRLSATSIRLCLIPGGEKARLTPDDVDSGSRIINRRGKRAQRDLGKGDQTETGILIEGARGSDHEASTQTVAFAIGNAAAGLA